MTVSLGEGLFQPQVVHTDPLLEPDPVPPRDPDIERHEQVLGALYAIQDALIVLASRPEVTPPAPRDLGALPTPVVNVDLAPVVEALERHEQTFTKFSERIGTLSKQVSALAYSGGGGTLNAEVMVNGGSLDSIRQPVQIAGIADTRSLAERMLARAPAPGYSLYLDTADTAFIYIAEVVSANGSSDPVFRGVRVPKDTAGNPLGRVQTATGFAWDARSAASWA